MTASAMPQGTLTLSPRETFVDSVRRAVLERLPFAAGKIGMSEKLWMYYPVLLAEAPNPAQRLAFEASLKFHALKQSGVFPADPAFLLRFADVYVEHLRTLDWIGVFQDRPGLEEALVRFHGLRTGFVRFTDQEPDRSVPDRPSSCYLPALRGKRLLLVCPFADVLRQRATADTFEAVWSRTGKRWFHPAAVDALEFPYGFDPSTWNRYATILDLYDVIADELSRREFDVALIAAGGLGIPLAAAARRVGKVGISLGGHLQVLFGVAGRRWTAQRQDYLATYINDAWIETPAHYRPDQ